MLEDDVNYRCFADLLLLILKWIGYIAAFITAAIFGCIIGLLLKS